MNIPVGYGQISWDMGGAGLPTRGTVTLGFENVGGLTAAAASGVAIAAWYDNIRPLQSVDIVGCICTVKLGPNETGPAASSTSSGGGVITGTGLLPSATLLVQKVTALGGRRNRGRMYWPGLTEADVDVAGNIAGARVTAFSGGFGDLFADLTAAGMEPVVLHSDAGAPTPITTFNVESQAATQRRRLRR